MKKLCANDELLASRVGEKLVNFLVEPKKGTKWPKNLPQFENRLDAIAICKDLCQQHFLLRCEKRGRGELGVSLLTIEEIFSCRPASRVVFPHS